MTKKQRFFFKKSDVLIQFFWPLLSKVMLSKKEKPFRNTISVSNSLEPDQAKIISICSKKSGWGKGTQFLKYVISFEGPYLFVNVALLVHAPPPP